MIRTEDIYDAVTDDAAFDALSSTLAHALGARSAVLHWGTAANDVEEISYSGYFTESHMAIYDVAFQNDDIWADAIDRSAVVNQAWNCEQFVPAATYERSRIYNEWIRPMGDDTFHCLGAVIRQGDVYGKIGLHRGRPQQSFGAADSRVLQDSIAHIGRMFVIRNKLDRAKHQERTLHATLDMVGHAVFVLKPSGALVECNLAAEAMLRRGDSLLLRQRQVKARDPIDDEALQAALRGASVREGGQATALFLHRAQGLPYILSIASVRVGGARQILAIATDPAEQDRSLGSRIRALYGLTRAEAEVAEALSAGMPLEQLAVERGVALNTIRTQMKNIYAKLDCSRQSELVARIRQLPRLSEFAQDES